MGRVQVQMAWQRYENTRTPWLRMTNPHAGSGKGMYFIPENGEEVLVAFENDNAEKPYVQGAMYNGNETSGYNTAGNDKKVIQTRSGTKIIMNDAIGSVFIEDPSGNTWMMNVMGSLKGNRESETAERNEIAKSTQFSATEKNFVVNSTKKTVNNSAENTKIIEP